MAKLSVVLLLLPVLANASSSSKNKSFFKHLPPPPQGIATNKVTSSLQVTKVPRGGAVGPLDADFATKLFIGAYGLNAVGCTLAGKVSMKTYGLKEDESNKQMMKNVGAAGMSHSLLMYLQTFKDMSFDKALAWSTLPFTLIVLYDAATGEQKKISFPEKKNIPSVLLNAAVFYAAMTEATWSKGLFTFYGMWSLFHGLMMHFSPVPAAKFWDIAYTPSPSGSGGGGGPKKTAVDPAKQAQFNFLVQNMGFFLLAHAVSVLLQVNGTSSLQETTGWTALTLAGGVLRHLVDGTFENVGVENVFAPAAWGGMLLVIALSLLIK